MSIFVPIVLVAACTSDFGFEALPQDSEGADEAVGGGRPVDDDETEEVEEEDEPEPPEQDEPEPPEQEEPEPEEEEEERYEEEPPEDDCAYTSDLVYVVERDNAEMYLFDPATLAVDYVGKLSCAGGSSPNSMGVARDGVAYVRYSDDRVYEVDLETLACTNTSYNEPSFGSFGMGYATDDADTWRDQLYVANERQVAKLDTSTWSLTTVGTLPSQSELTGNADGELWAFLPLERPAQLRRIDQVSGSALETVNVQGFPDPGNIDAFAFATWDGDFFLFVREYGMGNSTDVYQVQPDGTSTKVVSRMGFDIVGAGVSTCAPS